MAGGQEWIGQELVLNTRERHTYSWLGEQVRWSVKSADPSLEQGQNPDSRLSTASSTFHDDLPDDGFNLSWPPRRRLQLHGDVYNERSFGRASEMPLKSPISNDLDRRAQKNGEFRISRRKFADFGDLKTKSPGLNLCSSSTTLKFVKNSAMKILAIKFGRLKIWK